MLRQASIIRQRRCTRRGGGGAVWSGGPCGRPCGVIESAYPIAGDDKGTTGGHKGPHAAQPHSRPYGSFTNLHKHRVKPPLERRFYSWGPTGETPMPVGQAVGISLEGLALAVPLLWMRLV